MSDEPMVINPAKLAVDVLADPERYRGMTLVEAVEVMNDLRKHTEDQKKIKATAQKAFDFMRLTVVPETMDDEGIENIRVADVGRVNLQSDMHVAVKKADRGALHDWMDENGYEDLVTDTINGSTLKAWCKERLIQGEELPDMITVTPFTRAAITK